MYNKSLEILKQYWGYPSFRTSQQEVIDSVMRGNDTIALLPTGGGKSICFQVPTLAQDGICIVISPLIALIQDQVESLINKGIKAMAIPSGSSQEDMIRLFDNMLFGKYKFLYLSPERLQSKFIQDKIKQLPVRIIAIDEAHCISEWGHDFRPSYLQISKLKELKPEATTIALTATATTKVIEDITKHLQLDTPVLFKNSFFKPNLAYQIHYCDDKLHTTIRILKKNSAPSIIYVATRKNTKEISLFLNNQGFKSSFYHGGLSKIEKQTAFEHWMIERTPIMVATNAFGMGIDKPNVRIVLHLTLPPSIENYVQEAGRAGRDGKNSYAITLTNKADIQKLQERQVKNTPSIGEIKKIHQRLYLTYQIALGEHPQKPFDFDLASFCRAYNLPTNKTSQALQVLLSNGIINLQANFNKKSTVRFLVSSAFLINHCQKQPEIHKIIQVMLRLYGGVFGEYVTINEYVIAKKAKTTSNQVIKYLNELSEQNILVYKKPSKNSTLHFLFPREDDYTINRISKHITSYFQQKQKKITDTISFIENNQVCRSVQLLTYFEEKEKKACGMCDVCVAKKKKKRNNTAMQILGILQKHHEMSSKEICLVLHEEEQDILIHLRQLLANEIIGLTDYQKYFIRK